MTSSVFEQVDKPIDGGYGPNFEPFSQERAVTAAKREALARLTVPEGCVIEFVPTVPYVGGEPVVTPVIRHPINEDYAGLPA